MPRDMRFIVIPENEVSTAMLDDASVNPFGAVVPGAWAKLRRVNDSGVIKCVLKYDVTYGTPNAIALYLESSSPTVYVDQDALASALAEIETGEA